MQLQTAIPAPLKKAVPLRRSNRAKCLLCYLICFALPLAWQAIALLFLYPSHLVGTAPNIVENLVNALPFLQGLLEKPLLRSTVPAGFDPHAVAAALRAQAHCWLFFVSLCAGLAWALTLALQLVWRFSHSRAYMTAQFTQRAVTSYRLLQTLLWLCNALFAALLWLLGVQFIAGRNLWDFAVCFAVYPLNAMAAFACFRLAAPPAISGKHAFFKRL
ncbi:MAG: hypothetical protein RR696_01535 [Clostridia bacterium]